MLISQKQKLKELKEKNQDFFKNYYNPLPTNFQKVEINAKGKVVKDSGNKQNKWFIAEPRVSRRGNLERSETPKVEFHIKESYGSYKTSLDAKRAYIVGIEPNALNMSDEWILKSFSKQATLGYVRLRKID